MATKRSTEFQAEIHDLIETLGPEHVRIAEILQKNTTDNACLVKAAEDEPIFVLRAKDPLAANSVDEWVSYANTANIHQDKVEDAFRISTDMRHWRVVNVPKEKC